MLLLHMCNCVCVCFRSFPTLNEWFSMPVIPKRNRVMRQKYNLTENLVLAHCPLNHPISLMKHIDIFFQLKRRAPSQICENANLTRVTMKLISLTKQIAIFFFNPKYWPPAKSVKNANLTKSQYCTTFIWIHFFQHYWKTIILYKIKLTVLMHIRFVCEPPSACTCGERTMEELAKSMWKGSCSTALPICDNWEMHTQSGPPAL